MIKKIKGSLFAKIFAITFLLTSICCVLTYTVISWLVPKTYSTTLDASLENTVSSFIAELQTMSPLESGTLFDESGIFFSTSGDFQRIFLQPGYLELQESAQAFLLASGQDQQDFLDYLHYL